MEEVGEVMFCCEETGGQLVTLDYYCGRAVNTLGGGHNKIYVVETEGQVCALHPPEADGFSDDEDIGDRFNIEVQQLENIGLLRSIRCGRYHTLYLTIDGFLFSAGKGLYGVLGQGGAAQSPAPLLIKSLSDKHIIEIACGESHSLALTENGDLYGWGRGFEGQLGIRQKIECVSTPKFLDTFYGKKIKNVACGQRHSLCIDEAGVIYSWGEGRCGQLGRGKQRQSQFPDVVEIFDRDNNPVKAKLAAAGAGHSCVITEDGDLFAWGMNNYGQLGTGDLETRWLPVEIEKDIVGYYLKPIIKVTCSSYATFIIDQEGKIYSWGKGFLGHKSKTIEDSPRMIQLNTEHRIFTDIFACNNSVVFFAPLRIFSISPLCGPVTGDTKLTLIGTAFTETNQLRVRFRYGELVIEKEAELDLQSSSLQVITPNFAEDVQHLALPVQSYIDVTLDGVHYNTCDNQFLIFSDDLVPQGIHPKCASVTGGTQLSLYLNLDQFSTEWLWHLTVGFMPKPKGFNLNKSANTQISTPINRHLSHDDSHISNVSRGPGEGVQDIEWRLTPGKYKNGQVFCTVPQLMEFDENTMAYMVDVAINGQQFTKRALNFRYYDIEIQDVSPITGAPNESTTIRISGRGLYDSSAKKILMQGKHGEREVPVQWDRKLKSYLCALPPVSWLFAGEDPTHEILKETVENPIELKLTLNGAEFIDLPQFRYVDPHVVRICKVKVPDGMSEEDKHNWWESPEEENSEEPDDIRAKREAEEDAAMQHACKPGVKLYIYTTDIFDSEFLSVQFSLEATSVVVEGIFKNKGRVAVEVPDIGDIPTAQEVGVEISLNGQSFTNDGKVIKYYGASAHDEPVRGRRK